MTFQPYTYHIAWSLHNIHYYGVRLRPKSENDLWINYFTSSKYVKQARKLLGEPDVVEIRRTFSSESAARRWECRVLIRLRAKHKQNWLNKSDGKYNGSTEKKSQETRKRMSDAAKNHIKNNPEEWRKRIEKINKNPEKIAKMARTHTGMKRSQSTKDNLSKQKIEFIKRNGGPSNKGHKQYYDPLNPIEDHVQCFPTEAPINWIEGNWKAATKIIGVATRKSKFGVREYDINQQFLNDYCYITPKNSKKKIRVVPFSDKTTYISELEKYGFTIRIF